MTFFSARRIAAACVPCVAMMAALVVPGAANAALKEKCAGSEIVAAGSTLQKPAFHESANEDACNGTQGSHEARSVTYESIGSGKGLEDWGTEGHAFELSRVAIVATDEPPNATQIGEIDKNGGGAKSVETLPVLQGAVALLVHLPTGCTATSTSNPGRLVMDNLALQKLWVGEINTWGALVEANKGNGDALKGTGCSTATITRIVRRDASGTTHIFKKYLDIIDGSKFETETGEEKTWTEISEGPENTTWPKAAAVEREKEEGGGKEVESVAVTPSSVGYANLADAHGNKAFLPAPGGTGGAETATFWAPLQNSGTATTKPKFKDPQVTGEIDADGSANCVKTKYTNGKTKFPPKKTTEPWNEVTSAVKETNYPLCGLSYDLAVVNYAKYGGTDAEATTASNFLSFVLSTGTGGGQELIGKEHDYEPLTAPLDKEALKGLKEVVD
jgi:ABC-type phosphate transport system substrate-binding protein